MEIVRTFDIPKNNLLSIKYDGDEEDALSLLYDQWTSNEYLRDFFKRFQRDYQIKYGKCILKRVVREAKDYANELFDVLYDAASQEENATLEKLFQPLDNREKGQKSYEKQSLKGKGEERKSYLRIYAIRYRSMIIVTGGAIKLTDRMEYRKHTNDELKKLKLVKGFLEKDNPELNFGYLDI
ncbi:hypothetical protein FKX85_01720 [Echinicola soli]|uniref:Uncharacterized protein n=1 Tax=Echinicola soli TaxID=2591634 RepID=A0A514CDH8_9BACT|nr:hypothetical protein [Echinicola soli]QDH77830.1 hypothetical protein FKX85_01720 [Echinicola soli]